MTITARWQGAGSWLAIMVASLTSCVAGCVENSLPAQEDRTLLPAPAPQLVRPPARSSRRGSSRREQVLVVAEDSPKSAAPKTSPSAKTPGATAKQEPRYSHRKKVDPNGTGRFYMGREIAPVMGAIAAPWLERPQREQEESISKLVPALKVQPGMVVADIGAGSGVITVLLAEKVGPEGRVVAVDIQQQMLDLLARKLKQRKIENVVLVKGTTKSPELKPATLDLAIMVDVYHEFAFPYEMLQNIAQSLKPGGRVAFVEYRREDPAVPIKLVHKMSEAQVKLEAELPEFRLKWKETIPDLPWQHIVVFERLPDEKGTIPSGKK